VHTIINPVVSCSQRPLYSDIFLFAGRAKVIRSFSSFGHCSAHPRLILTTAAPKVSIEVNSRNIYDRFYYYFLLLSIAPGGCWKKKPPPSQWKYVVWVVCILLIIQPTCISYNIQYYTRSCDSRHDEDSLHHYLCGCTLSRSHPPPLTLECTLGPFLTNRLAPSGGWKHRGGRSWCVWGGGVAAGILHLYTHHIPAAW